MGLVTKADPAGAPLTERAKRVVDSVLSRMGVRRKMTERQRYEAMIESSTITPEQRRKAMENAAANPEIGPALDEADRAYENWVEKGLESGELRHRSGARGSSGG